MVDRIAVESSNISSVGYDEDNGSLEVEFHSGAVYQYLDVPRYVYEDMMIAESVGKYFNEVIKSSYTFNRMER